jgi:hypothetical protein
MNKRNSKYKKLVNFKSNLILPRHGWFNIKEGYSKDLVTNIIEDLNIDKNDGLVMDPFSGSGTSVLSCSEIGYKSIGIEVNPFLHFLSETKSSNYDIDLKGIISSIAKIKISKNLTPPELSISKKLFGDQLDTILSTREWINKKRDKKTKNLLKVAYLSSLEICSYAKKDGNGLKYPKNRKPRDFLDVFKENLEIINGDIVNTKLKSIPKIYLGNSWEIMKNRKFKGKYKNKVSLCVFSPPYANCFDYTEVYKMELWFGDFVSKYEDLKVIRKDSMTSHLNKKIEESYDLRELMPYINKIDTDSLWSKKIPTMVKSYFSEMYELLENIFDYLIENGHCVIIVGNSAYGNIVIPTDEILKKIAKRIGFKKTIIQKARMLGTSSQQYKKIDRPDLLRESLIFLQK